MNRKNKKAIRIKTRGNILDRPLCFCGEEHWLNRSCIISHHFNAGSNMIKLFDKMSTDNPNCKCCESLVNYKYIHLNDLDSIISSADLREYYFTGHWDHCPMKKIYVDFVKQTILPKVLNLLILSYVTDLEDFDLRY